MKWEESRWLTGPSPARFTPAMPSGQATSAEGAATSVLLGALVGLAISVAIGVGFYRGARVINLRTFFKWTGAGLIVVAALLL